MRGILFLIGLVAVLVLGLWLAGDDGDSDRQAVTAEPVLGGRLLSQADRISVRNQVGGETIEFERRAARFELVEPIVDLASHARMESLERIFDTAMQLPTYEPEEIDDDLLAQTGLDRPRGEVKIAFAKIEIRLELGADGPIGQEVFMRRSGRIYRVPKSIYSGLQGTVDDFREHLVFANAADRVRRVRVRRLLADRSYEEMVLEQRSDGQVWLAKPVSARADQASARAFLGRLLGMQADDFPHGNMEPRPEPNFVVEVEGPAGKEEVRIWLQGNQAIVGLQQPRQLQFTLGPSDYGAMLRLPAEQLRSRLLIPFALDELTRLELVGTSDDAKVLVLERGLDNLLKLTRPVNSPANPTAVNQLLHALRNLGVMEFVPDTGADLGKFGLDRGYTTLKLTGQFGLAPTVIHFGKDDGEASTFARRADEQHVVKVSRAMVSTIRRPWPEYVGREVYRNDTPAQVWVVRIERRGKVAEYRRAGDGSWRREGRASEDVEEFLDSLSPLRARRVLELSAQPGEEVLVQLETQNGAVLETLRFFLHGRKARVRTRRVPVLYEVSAMLTKTLLAIAPE